MWALLAEPPTVVGGDSADGWELARLKKQAWVPPCGGGSGHILLHSSAEDEAALRKRHRAPDEPKAKQKASESVSM